MERHDIKNVMAATQKIEQQIQDMPYKAARSVMQQLDEIRGVVCADLPGGEYAECPQCEEVKGVDEMESVGDEDFCNSCAASWRQGDGQQPVS